MAILTTAIVNLLVILAIGIGVGLLWPGRPSASATGVGNATHALVGIAGSFIGFHIAVILGLLPSPLMFYLAALIAAVITVWLWRGR